MSDARAPLRIGIDIRAAGGEKAGIGNYMYHLAQHLETVDGDTRYVLYSDRPIEGLRDTAKLQLKIFRYPSILWHFRVLLDIICRGLDLYYTPSLAATALLGRKYALFIPDLTPYLFPRYHTFKVKIAKLFYRRAIEKARIVITISANSRNDIVTAFPRSKDKTNAILLSMADGFARVEDTAVLERVRAKYNLPRQYMLFVGSIEPRKNLTGLLKAFHKVKSGLAHKVVVVGGKGWLNSEIYRIVNDLGLQNDVLFTGYVQDDDLPALYTMASLFVYPSFYEGFGIPILEAMACGTPVVASNTSSLPEIAGDAALLVDPLDTAQMALLIVKVLGDQKLSEDLVKKGKERIQVFSWHKTARETQEQLGRACGSCGKGRRNEGYGNDQYGM